MHGWMDCTYFEKNVGVGVGGLAADVLQGLDDGCRGIGRGRRGWRVILDKSLHRAGEGRGEQIWAGRIHALQQGGRKHS